MSDPVIMQSELKAAAEAAHAALREAGYDAFVRDDVVQRVTYNILLAAAKARKEKTDDRS